MNAESSLFRAALAAGVACVLTFSGCEKKAQVSSADSGAVADKLAKADALDGTEDKVVSKCAGCALGMAGKAGHALTVGDYSLHFCSEDCKNRFAKDPDAAVLAMKIPE